VPYQEQATVLRGDAGQRVERLRRIEPARQRRMLAQQPALLLAPALGRELGRPAGALLRADQHLVERNGQALNGDAGGTRLMLPARRQPPLRVFSRPVRLRLGVP